MCSHTRPGATAIQATWYSTYLDDCVPVTITTSGSGFDHEATSVNHNATIHTHQISAKSFDCTAELYRFIDLGRPILLRSPKHPERSQS